MTHHPSKASVGFVIGDIHGCKSELDELLVMIDWQPEHSQLWLVGDLVNRGPHSIDVLRWAFEHRDAVCLVLGNHDIHLIARWAGVTSRRTEDCLSEVLKAPEIDSLMEWLRCQPLAIHHEGRLLVHAGVHPHWDLQMTLDRAKDVCDQLGGPHFEGFLRRSYSVSESNDSASAAMAILTRIRMVGADGTPAFGYTGSPEKASAGLVPWFENSRLVAEGNTVFFGHWAQMGLTRSEGATCIDSACVYGGSLSAIAFDDGKVFSVLNRG